ncbi:MAG: flagellar hook protein FlgE [Burkholderiales bacterium]|nr:flagellar hook protein FlgE [Burkholderiales bacterium]
MSFQQSLSGLNAASKNLEIIGNNVSNANTVGFKSSRAQFADIYANSLLGSGKNSAGIGVTVQSIAQQFGQGNITVSSNPLDVAINGSGFFRLSTGGAITYTRNGQFQVDKDSYLVNASGARVTGYPADANGNVVQTAPVELALSTADLAPKATASSKLVANLDSRTTTTIAAPFNPNDATTYHTASGLTVYDSLGNERIMQVFFRRTAPNTWEVFMSEGGTALNGGAAVGTLNFTTGGVLTPTAPFNISFTSTNGAVTPQVFTLDFAGTTQFGAQFGVTSITQDGYATGKLAGFSIGTDGVILGRYSNGQTRAQGQIVLSSFANPQGLVPLGDNQWAESSISGQPVVGAPQGGNLGNLQSGALEESNIDLTRELVDMITAQRIYQANAQTIKTQDQMLQTLVNLR